MKSHVEQYEARSGILNQVLDDIRRQIRNLPASSDQARSAVRRELDSFRNSLEAAMRRITTVESNMRTLNGMNNRIMAQLSDIEGHVDEAADIIQGVQQNQQNPQGLRERRNVGYDAFAGQGPAHSRGRKWSGYRSSGWAGWGCWLDRPCFANCAR